MQAAPGADGATSQPGPNPTEEPESAELASFRKEAREWIEANKPAAPDFKMPQSFLEVESRQQVDYLRDWQGKLYEAGLLGFDFPKEYGGQGIDRDRQRIANEEQTRAGAPFLVNRIALQWAAPTIMAYGTEEQKQKHIKRIISCEDIWCQGFSEPGSGSDLASLQSRAEKTDDGYVVNGHKVWTTLAHFASYMILMARTDPTAHKYSGISYFLFPMDANGITIRPLVKMTREGGFNQVIFDDAKMPQSALLGEEGQGWQIAMTTLMFERGAAQGGLRELAAAYLSQTRRLIDLAARTQRNGKPLLDDPVARDRVVQFWTTAQGMAMSTMRGEAKSLNVERPMALPLMSKLVSSEWNQRLCEFACELLGPDAALWLNDPNATDKGEWPRGFMNSFGMTIGGGTSQILRNILGERVLGLPKSK